MKNFKKLINLSEKVQKYTDLKNKIIEYHSNQNFDLQEIIKNLDDFQELYFEIQTALNYLLTCPNCANNGTKNEKSPRFYRNKAERNF